MDEALAVNAAMSLPAWLENGENFALSGGLGFSGGGETAVGVNGIVRIDKSVAGFAGAAVSTSGSSGWAGHAGLRFGW
jgi:hypothetical protein